MFHQLNISLIKLMSHSLVCLVVKRAVLWNNKHETAFTFCSKLVDTGKKVLSVDHVAF